MSYQRLAYDDQDSTLQMQADCVACATRLPRPRTAVDVSAVLAEPPSLEYDDFPVDQPKRAITVSEAAAHLASRLHLHLD
ncbi:MAG TPA: hypothetical protein VFK34_02450 [Marmoricola sp.]|jgi:hypothetical protein|nr:hypothetical protein [Marmoricola sp.]